MVAAFLDTSPSAVLLSELLLSPLLFHVKSTVPRGSGNHGGGFARLRVGNKYGQGKSGGRKSCGHLTERGTRRAKAPKGTANAAQNQDAAKFRTQGCQERSPLHVSPTGGLKQCVTQKSDPLLKCPRQEREEPEEE